MFIASTLFIVAIKLLFEKYKGFKKKVIRLFKSKKIHKEMDYLYGSSAAIRKEELFITRKINLILLCLLAGSLLAGLVVISQRAAPVLIDGYYLQRPDYNEEQKSYELTAKADGEERQNISVYVSERVYEDEDIKNMATELTNLLPELIIGDNESLDNVTEGLNLVKKVEDYPFNISYKSEKPLILKSDGSIDAKRLNETLEENGDDSMIIKLIAVISYEDFKEELELIVRIVPKSLTKEEDFVKRLTKSIKEADRSDRTYEKLELPKEIEGKRIFYEEKKNIKAFGVFAFSILAAIMLSYGKDDELSKKIADRNEQMESDYPLIVNQYALYYCAGMHPKSIWKEMCNEYRAKISKGEKRRYAFEEMLNAQALMDDGAGEVMALNDFAARCQIKKYKGFVNLIQQSLVKGKEEMSLELKAEAEEASNERLLRARKKGEEAGTKLLLPMFMMMSIVLIIVIIPAFINFKV